MTSAPDAKSVVSILSTNYAGSHYLSLLLGSHSRAAHIGEAHRVETAPDAACAQCGGSCRVFVGIDHLDVEFYPRVFENLEATGHAVDVLVDASKKPRWASRHLDSPIPRKYIHLIADPRAVVRRWQLRSPSARQRLAGRWKRITNDPRSLPRVAFESYDNVLVDKWLTTNRRITDFIEANGLDHTVVATRDVAADTEATLRWLMPWIGLDFEPSQICYWDHEHHGTQKPEYGWIADSKTTGWIDVRWRDDLPRHFQDSVPRRPSVTNYLDAVGLRFTDDGLTKALR